MSITHTLLSYLQIRLRPAPGPTQIIASLAEQRGTAEYANNEKIRSASHPASADFF